MWETGRGRSETRRGEVPGSADRYRTEGENEAGRDVGEVPPALQQTNIVQVPGESRHF